MPAMPAEEEVPVYIRRFILNFHKTNSGENIDGTGII